MVINITTRHIELNSHLKDYVYKKVEKVKKYFRHFVNAQMILSTEKYWYIAELFTQAKGNNIRAKEQAEDIYSAIDKVMDKVGKQLKKHKEKLNGSSSLSRKSARGVVFPPPSGPVIA